MLKTGTRLRDLYQIERVLGKGGMGGVYQASYLGNGGGTVAVKEMHLHLFKDSNAQEGAVRQFQAEAVMLYTLRHPSLPRMYDFFSLEDRWFLVMDFINGVTLRQYLEEHGPATEAFTRRMLREVADVLGYMHRHKPPIIFRDMKPGNIMMDTDESFKLIDFGIAKLLESGEFTTSFIRGSGTRGFASLEQYSGGTDERSDIYSLGATCYTMLTGKIPPPAPALAMGSETLEPLPVPEVTAEFAAIIGAMMELSAANRPHTADILQRLAALPPLGDEAPVAAPSPVVVQEAPTARLAPPVSWTILLVGEAGPVDEWSRAAARYHRRFHAEPKADLARAWLDEHPITAVVFMGLPDPALAARCRELAIPFFVVASVATTPVRLQMTELGCTAYFRQPVPVSRVVEGVEAVIRSHYRRPPVVLVVDDDPIALTAIEGNFEQFGLTVHCLEDSIRFWETVEQVYPDFLIMDIEMPGATGLDLCRSVRSDARWRALPILILTSSNDAGSIDAVYSAGADDYASKPIFVADLVTRITQRLRRIDYLTPPTIAAEAVEEPKKQPASRWRKVSKT